MQVLVVEDSNDKFRELEAFLERNFGVSTRGLKPPLTRAKDIATAFNVLAAPERKWDVVLLDMTFQRMNGAADVLSIEPLAGIEVLQYLAASGVAVPVLVLTQYSSFGDTVYSPAMSLEQLDLKLKKAFPDNYRGVVFVDLASKLWLERVGEFIRGVNNA
jgi:CheY-like chemotaxis protein